MRDTVGWLGTWLRLLWRHWPVLLTLAAAAVLIRTALISYVLLDAARWRDGLGGDLLLAVLPIVMLVSMILMLRVVRPSLPFLGPRERPEPALRHLASVAVPFVAFYFTAEYFVRDLLYFDQAAATRRFVESFEQGLTEGTEFEVEAAPLPYVLASDPEFYLMLAAGAFVVRWILVLLGSARHTWLGLLAIYPEVTWVYASLVATTFYLHDGRAWFERTRVYQWFTSQVDGLGIPWVSALVPNVEAAGSVLVIPIAALVAGTTVLVASSRPRPVQASGLRRLLPVRPETPVGGQFGVLRDSLSRAFHAGLPATMLFCLAFALASAAPAYLSELERILIGHRDFNAFWFGMEFPLIYLNEAIALVLVFALIAAFVDRTARRQAAQTGDGRPAPVPTDLSLADTQQLPIVATSPGPYAASHAGPGPYGHGPGPYGPPPGQAPYAPYGSGPPPYGQPSTGSRT